MKTARWSVRCWAALVLGHRRGPKFGHLVYAIASRRFVRQLDRQRWATGRISCSYRRRLTDNFCGIDGREPSTGIIDHHAATLGLLFGFEWQLLKRPPQ
jgi:hypothetical protein